MWTTERSGTVKKFRVEHEAEFIIHQAAKKHFYSLSLQKLPTVKARREEYAGLLEKKCKAYTAYKETHAEMQELQNVWVNVEYMLDISAAREAERSKADTRR